MARIRVGSGLFFKKSLLDAIMYAIDGDVITVENGIYELEEITISKNIKIIGNESVFIRGKITINMSKSVVLENITFLTDPSFCSLFISNSNVDIINCKFTESLDFVKRNIQTYYRLFGDKSNIRIISSEFILINPLNLADVGFKNSNIYLENNIIKNMYLEKSEFILKDNELREYIKVINGYLESNGDLYLTENKKRFFSITLEDNSSANIKKITLTNENAAISLKHSDIKIDSIESIDDNTIFIENDEDSNIHIKDLKYVESEYFNDNFNKEIESNSDKQRLEDVELQKKAEVTKMISDKKIETDEQKDYLKELEQLHGIDDIIVKVKEFLSIAEFNQRRKEDNLSTINFSLHSAFLGNPGTGKTTVARLIGKILKQYDVIKSDKLIEVSRADLVGEYVGQTAIKTNQVLKDALGGVLFIDEAYSLYSQSSNDFGKEAVDCILKFMEDHKDEIMIIFAGYKNEMELFFNMNPGFKSRVNHTFEFNDYSPEDIAKIGLNYLKGEQYQVDEEYYKRAIKKLYSTEVNKTNARFVRNFNESIILKTALRLSSDKNNRDHNKITKQDINAVIGEDLDQEKSIIDENIQKLNSLIGLTNVKTYVTNLVKQAKIEKYLEKVQGYTSQKPTYHMLFTGNPGTGKTTVARIIANIFLDLGILSNNNVIEVTRKDLVGQYIGESEIKTKEKIEQAMGGVLFIDEAYQLSMNKTSGNDFGINVIETLLAELENKRDKFICILAGYDKPMQDFLETNPGLRSRIPISIHFDDYTGKEISEILRKYLSVWDLGTYPLEEKIIQKYESLDPKYKSNARWARNLSERIIQNHKIYLLDNEVKDLMKVDEKVLDESIDNF